MALANPPVCDFGRKAPDFSLAGTDGRAYALSDVAGPKGTLIMFICNHCPYVTGIVTDLVADAVRIAEVGIGVAAICANDARAYPQDSVLNMGRLAETNGFEFPYLHDETQEVARAYDAVCTPDFFGFDAGLGLQYRGRFAEGRARAQPGARRELYEAMKLIAKTGEGPREQVPSMGCSIKWQQT